MFCKHGSGQKEGESGEEASGYGEEGKRYFKTEERLGEVDEAAEKELKEVVKANGDQEGWQVEEGGRGSQVGKGLSRDTDSGGDQEHQGKMAS